MIAEACAQGKAQGSSQGLGAGLYSPARAALGTESQGHSRATAAAIAPRAATALPSPRAGCAGKPAQSPAPEHKS